jgi:hypothetical protein
VNQHDLSACVALDCSTLACEDLVPEPWHIPEAESWMERLR